MNPQQPRGTIRRGSVKGPVLRNCGLKSDDTYLLNLHIAMVFLGGGALCMLWYAWVTPYWYMMDRRAYTVNPELRVLGLTNMLEGAEDIGVSWIWNKKALRRKYDMRQRRDRVCNPNLQVSDLDDEKHCDMDCQDMKLMGDLRVLCSGERMMAPEKIPIVPAPRVRATFNERMRNMTSSVDDLELRWGCKTRPPNDWGAWWGRMTGWTKRCPMGFREKHTELQCEVGGQKWDEIVCEVDKSEDIGDTMFGVKEAPSYLHVFGWAQWRHREVFGEDEDKWCSVRQFRCRTLTQFAANGLWCFYGITFAGLLIFTALAISVSKYKDKAILFVALLFLLGSVTTLASSQIYHRRTKQAVWETTTPVDEWKRPYVHSMKFYDYKDRTILRAPKGSHMNAEWLYYHINARVDYVTQRRPNAKRAFTTLWGPWFSTISGFVSFAAFIVAVETACTLRGFYPLSKLVYTLVGALLFVPSICKRYVDNNLAAYPVLFVYPWQKLYPKAFTAGSWLCFPFDQMWDLGFMLPVHVLRAIWDYVSCQDITSPHEKAVLHKEGITNDRLCSLMCSRRSYFAMMAGLGTVNFLISLAEVVGISDQLAPLRQAMSRKDQYPIYRCDSVNGNCPLDKPDPESMGRYIRDMTIRTAATIYEGSMHTSTLKALCEWLGGFIAITCAVGALSTWTNFSVSRKFCLMGWIFMMLTPIITSSFPENGSVNWPRVEEQIVDVSAEIWEESMYFISKQDCDEVLRILKKTLNMGRSGCWWAQSFSLLMPGMLLESCDNFDDYLQEHRHQIETNASKVCSHIKTYASDGADARKKCVETVKKATPDMIDVYKVLVGLQAGTKNKMKLLGAVMGMAPALMQGGLMIKNMIPRQTTPAILTTLPFAFTTLIWAQYQIYYQVLTGVLFLLAALAMSFGPMVYYLFAKHYRIVQPMCDQQSVTLTFRIWWYAAICSLIIPYTMMLAYFIWVNDFQRELLYQKAIGGLTLTEALSLVFGVLSSYAYSLQAGIDWFVDEIVSHHTLIYTPAMLTATSSQQEAEEMQKLLAADLHLDTIDKATYVCGGLGDPVRMCPPEQGTWNEKAQVYASSLAYKDYATLDAFAGHIKKDPDLPVVLARARRPWYRTLSNPPDGAFHGMAITGIQEASTGNPQPEPVEATSEPAPTAEGRPPELEQH